MKALCLYTGLLLITAALLVGGGAISGLLNLPEQFFNGENAIHSIARLAVTGCLFAAIGSLE